MAWALLFLSQRLDNTMSTQQTGGPAFPYAFPDHRDDDYNVCQGMMLRDYFAAKELTSANRGLSYLNDKREATRIATHCYMMADAMLEARNK